MSAFVSELTRLRDQYSAEEQELKRRIASDQARFSEVQTLRAACETLIKAHEAAPSPRETDLLERGDEDSLRTMVLEILTAKAGLGYTPADIHAIVKEKLPDIISTQIQTTLGKLVEGGLIKYGEGHYYS